MSVKNEILHILESNKGSNISGQETAKADSSDFALENCPVMMMCVYSESSSLIPFNISGWSSTMAKCIMSMLVYKVNIKLNMDCSPSIGYGMNVDGTL